MMRLMILLLCAYASSLMAATLDTLSMNFKEEIHSYHPFLGTREVEEVFFSLSGYTLLQFSPNLEYECAICVPGYLPSLENKGIKLVSPKKANSPVSLTLKLNPQFKWGDGTPLTSEDIEFSWRVGKALWKDSEIATGYEEISHIKKKPDGRVQLFFPKLVWPLPKMTRLRILPAHLEEPIFKKNTGNVENYLRESLYALKPFEKGLWLGAYVPIEVKDQTLILKEQNPGSYKSIHLILDKNRVPKTKGEAVVRDSFFQYVLFFNLRDPLTRSLPLRQALSHMISRVNTVPKNERFVGSSHFLLAAHPAYGPFIADYENNPLFAEKTLEAGGFELRQNDEKKSWRRSGKPFTLRLTLAGDPDSVHMAEALKTGWEKIHIHARLEKKDPLHFQKKTLRRADYDQMILGRISIIGPEDWYYLFHSGMIPSAKNNHRGLNISYWANKKADKLIEDWQRTMPEDKRQFLAQKFQELLSLNLPAIPIASERLLEDRISPPLCTKALAPAPLSALLWVRQAARLCP